MLLLHNILNQRMLSLRLLTDMAITPLLSGRQGAVHHMGGKSAETLGVCGGHRVPGTLLLVCGRERKTCKWEEPEEKEAIHTLRSKHFTLA